MSDTKALIAAAWHDGFAQGDTYARGMVGQPGPPDDPQAAYDAAIRAAKIEGMREAKASAENAFKKLLPTAAFWIVLYDDAITALIKETEKGGT